MKTRVLRQKNSSFAQTESICFFKVFLGFKTSSFQSSPPVLNLNANLCKSSKLEFWGKTRVLMCYTENWFLNSWTPPVLDQHLQFSYFKGFHQVFIKRWKLEFWWYKTQVLGNLRAINFFQLKTSSFDLTPPVLMFWTSNRFFIKSPKLEFWMKTRVLGFYIKTHFLAEIAT